MSRLVKSPRVSSDVNCLKKRERRQNWTYEEKRYLLDLCKNDLIIIENRRVDADLNALKNRAWIIIHREFTKLFGNKRTFIRLKEQWQRMKSCTRAEIMDYHHRLSIYGQDIADKKRPDPFTFELWDFVQEAKTICRRKAMKGFDYSKFQLVLEGYVPDDDNNDWSKVEIEDEMFDSEDDPSNSKRPHSSNSNNFNNSVVLNDDDTPSLLINNVAVKMDTLKVLKSGQFDANVPLANGDDHSYEYGYTKILEIQTREHAIRMKILQLQLLTATFNRDVAELNKRIILKNVDGLNGRNNGQI